MLIGQELVSMHVILAVVDPTVFVPSLAHCRQATATLVNVTGIVSPSLGEVISRTEPFVAATVLTPVPAPQSEPQR